VTEWLAAHELIHPTWTLTSLGSEIDEFKQAPAGHLFVAGRFDGMDFKADECRLVVLATLPRAINLQEEFYSAYLRDAGFMLRRLNQRIIQALGRCNRAEDDFALYILADRRFKAHFGRESQRVGVPANIVAEIDCAEDAADLPEAALVERVRSFLNADFVEFDRDLAVHRADVPEHDESSSGDEDSNDEVSGWLELFQRQNYQRAAEHFEACVSDEEGLSELPAFLRWCEAKSIFLAGEQGDPVARANAPMLLEQAIGHGRTSSWFNRQRAALNRYRHQAAADGMDANEFAQSALRVFDDRLERLGRRDTRFERWANRTRDALASRSHDHYLTGLVELGELLGYTATRPSHTAATDCRWRAVHANAREVVTFEAKVEHEPSGQINPSAVGQAHNQHTRALQEFESLGYAVRSTIVTHLTEIADAAQASLGSVRILPVSAVEDLFETVLAIMSDYRDRWSVDNLDARRTAAAAVIDRFPEAGWLTRALEDDEVFLRSDELLAEWG
jgi:hypothetical protein